MNQMRDIIVMLIAALYHLGMFAGTAYLVYWKDASAWVFLVPLCMTMHFSTKDEK